MKHIIFLWSSYLILWKETNRDCVSAERAQFLNNGIGIRTTLCRTVKAQNLACEILIPNYCFALVIFPATAIAQYRLKG